MDPMAVAKGGWLLGAAVERKGERQCVFALRRCADAPMTVPDQLLAAVGSSVVSMFSRGVLLAPAEQARLAYRGMG